MKSILIGIGLVVIGGAGMLIWLSSFTASVISFKPKGK